MSNFRASTRRRGTADEFKEAEWLDGYFGGRHFGVRFDGDWSVLDGDDFEIQEVMAE